MRRKSHDKPLTLAERFSYGFFAALLCGVAATANAQVFDALADAPLSPDKHYLFFLHGAIYEGASANPVHPQFGRYDFTALTAALDGTDRLVIAPRRPKSAQIEDYARRLVADIRGLLAQGIRPERIAVIGFSKGGAIASRASALLAQKQLRFALLAACPRPASEQQALKLTGRLVSLYEAADQWMGSCRAIVNASPGVVAFSETVLHSGRRHGEFYQPHSQWLKPLNAWLAATR